MDIRRTDLPWQGQVQGRGEDELSDTGEDAESSIASTLPWKPRTRQEQGRQTEKATLKRRGAKGHPNSGAGSIKYDGSTQEEVIEVKDAVKSFTLNRDYLMSLFKHAARQSKQAVLVVEFPDLTVEARITRHIKEK